MHDLPPAVPYPEAGVDWPAICATPQVDASAWIAPGAIVYGRVAVGPRSSIWYGCIVRGDHERIAIGADTNLQDGAILHVDPGYPCLLGNRITVGHRAIVHGSVVEDGALIGISATVLSRCVVGAGALVAAGAVVLEGTVIPPGTLWAGCPARQLRELSPAQQLRLERNWQHYVNNAIAHHAAQTTGQIHHPPSTNNQ